MRVHPYAIIIGIGLGVMVGLALRHPLFAIFTAILSIILLDLGFRQNQNSKGPKDPK